MDWLTHIDDFTNQLADIAEVGDLSAPVPTCPDWTLADLAWHLLEVQDFWTWIIGNRPAGPDNYVGSERPSDNELATGLREACDRLATSSEIGRFDSARSMEPRRTRERHTPTSRRSSPPTARLPRSFAVKQQRSTCGCGVELTMQLSPSRAMRHTPSLYAR